MKKLGFLVALTLMTNISFADQGTGISLAIANTGSNINFDTTKLERELEHGAEKEAVEKASEKMSEEINDKLEAQLEKRFEEQFQAQF